MDKQPLDSTAPAGGPDDVRGTVRQYVLEHIQRGDWPVGARVPTEKELASRFATSRSTVNQVMKVLESQGIVQQFRRRGTFVASVPTEDASPASRSRRPRRGLVHVLSPLRTGHASMHWNEATLTQLESALNADGLQVAHRSLPDAPPIDEFRALIDQATREGSRAMVILSDLIMAGDSSPSREEAWLLPYAQALQAYPGRVCWLNRRGVSLASWTHDAVSLSPLGEGVAVGQYLRQQQVGRIICVGSKRHRWSRMRVSGLQIAIRGARPRIKMRKLWTNVLHDAPLANAYRKIFDDVRKRRDRPTVIIPNDVTAVRLLDMARDRGLRCPEDFCLISFNNDQRYRDYDITTVAPPATHLGEIIADQVNAQLNRPTGTAVNTTLKSVIVERSTFMLDDDSPSHETPSTHISELDSKPR